MTLRRSLILLALMVAGMTPSWATFSSLDIRTLTASATVGPASTGTVGNLVITAASLPGQAFFGKNLVIPVQVTNPSGPLNTQNLGVDIVYQLLDASGSILTPPTSVTVQFISSPGTKNSVLGTASIPRSQLVAIQNGGTLTYVFRATQGAASSVLGAGAGAGVGNATLNAPFQTGIINQLCQPVSPAGARVSVPDLVANDGRTAVALNQGAVTSAGTLCLKQEDVSAWPLGPGGSKAATIYSITLKDTSLTSTAQLVLSYPSDASGKVLESSADPNTLGLYWLDENAIPRSNGLWRPLSRATLDTTLHTVTGMTGHFSTFGLFATGAIGAADLRPSQRIITPNGDGINDIASFSGLGVGDDVKIFDVRGRRVRTLAGGTSTVWDGKDDDGKTVESGIYIYQYTSQGDRVSGVIGVAK